MKMVSTPLWNQKMSMTLATVALSFGLVAVPLLDGISNAVAEVRETLRAIRSGH